jgi:hypothetical protein
MRNPYADMAARWDEAVARRLGDTPSPPQVPKPPVPDSRATAAFIVAAGRRRRAEEDEGGAPLEQNESGQQELQPGGLILRAVEKQRKEREGR